MPDELCEGCIEVRTLTHNLPCLVCHGYSSGHTPQTPRT